MEKTEENKRVLETNTRTIVKGKTTQSMTLPKFFKAAATFLNMNSLEVRTIRDDKTGEVYLEVHLVKEKKKEDEKGSETNDRRKTN